MLWPALVLSENLTLVCLSQNRALVTYIQRLYFPYMIRDPKVVSEGQLMIAVWSYEDPRWAGTDLHEECRGTMVIANSLSLFLESLWTSVKALKTVQRDVKGPSTFHFVLVGDGKDAMDLFPEAESFVDGDHLAGMSLYQMLLALYASRAFFAHFFRLRDIKNVNFWSRLKPLRVPCNV